jgi:ribosomal protein S18 acetylase RimI-like enzyme
MATQLLELSAETTSPGYITDKAVFTEYATHEHRSLFVYYEHGAEGGVAEITDAETLARSDWTIRGFALTGQFTIEEYRDQLHVPLERLFEETTLTPEDFPLSVVKVLAVAPDQQARGIGTQLGAAAAAETFKAPPVVTMIWLRENPANVKMARHYSEFVLATFEDYFPDGWVCPDCGPTNDCTCSVALYGWFADERASLEAGREGAKTDLNHKLKQYAD